MLARARMAYLPQDVHFPDETRAWMRDVVLADENVWVAEVDDEVVAYGSVGNGYLNHLYVHPQHQGRGIGSALLNQAKAQAWEGLKLWTFEPNQGAIRFYEAHGFVTCKTTDGRDNEESVPDRLMAWRP